MDAALLAVLIPTFFFVSVTPGMCMTLALTLGISLGVRRTMWMMWGELLGVATVVTATVYGIAGVMLNYPLVFDVFKYVGGAYLAWLGIQMWRSRGKMAITSITVEAKDPNFQPRVLMLQGFVTAIANPKGWAFTMSLLPPFLDSTRPLGPQLVMLLSVIMVTEFSCMMLYASGGKSLRIFLQQGNHVRTLNRIAGSLMIGVGAWLAFF